MIYTFHLKKKDLYIYHKRIAQKKNQEKYFSFKITGLRFVCIHIYIKFRIHITQKIIYHKRKRKKKKEKRRRSHIGKFAYTCIMFFFFFFIIGTVLEFGSILILFFLVKFDSCLLDFEWRWRFVRILLKFLF